MSANWTKVFSIALILIGAVELRGQDAKDAILPKIITEARDPVEVSIRQIKRDREWATPTARMRMIDGRVMLEDIKYYPNCEVKVLEGLVSFGRADVWGACDKKGKVVIEPQFDCWFEFQSGLAAAMQKGRLGYIDHSGKWVIQPQFDTDLRWDFVGDVCAVGLGGKYLGGKYAVIDKKGGFVWLWGLIRAEPLVGGIYIITADGREGFLDDKGKLIPGRKPNQRARASYLSSQK